tara:strand:+ start:993 stop:1502 length:510 start_codon:yes stop_codon:yes gene_type:complete
MKKILFLLFIISIIGCETNTIEIEKTSGEWFRGESKGKKYMLADDKYSELAFKFMDAYENMDPETMVEMTKDTVKFHPGDISGVFDVDMTNTDFIVERQSNWDSISRNYAFILPLKLEDTNYTVVETSFRENRYIKDGSIESSNIYERLYFNNEDKIARVVQWMRPSAN